MRAFPTLLLSWLATGFAAALGSILGNAAGARGLQVGAVAGGVLGLLAAVVAARRLAWLPGRETRGAFVGGVIGFAMAVPITLTHMGTPVIPVLSCALAGIGTLLGAGVARGWARSGSSSRS
jgi:hypothetical protein